MMERQTGSSCSSCQTFSQYPHMEESLPLKLIAKLVGVEAAERVGSIQSLWSGYGEIVRVRLLDQARATDSSVIVKHVCPPNAPDHKYGWASDVSHQRKLKSYEVELNWYRNFSAKCEESNCRVARFIAGEQVDSTWLIVLEDLDASGFSLRHRSVSDSQLDACLQWLANFHATFLMDSKFDGSPASHGLWPIGTYWHLETRPDELAAMPNGLLKQAAAAIDDRLNKARFQTIVHGDAKLANFCFSSDDQVAAVDFQYVGGGCGMKDVAYFISSCFNDSECERRESELLDRYFAHLKTAIGRSTNERLSQSFADLESEWRSLYCFAWADFYRFLAGWSPGHWKMHGYSERVTQTVLDELAGQSEKESSTMNNENTASPSSDDSEDATQGKPNSQPNNPLHGVKLADMLELLVEQYGWQELGDRININCFNSNPSIKSSLKFLRKTQWARDKVERLYLRTVRRKQKR